MRSSSSGICRLAAANGGEDSVTVDYFPKGSAPKEPCSLHMSDASLPASVESLRRPLWIARSRQLWNSQLLQLWIAQSRRLWSSQWRLYWDRLVRTHRDRPSIVSGPI